jgi:hypothetical protein
MKKQDVFLSESNGDETNTRIHDLMDFLQRFSFLVCGTLT